jgi:hypothetical protein
MSYARQRSYARLPLMRRLPLRTGERRRMKRLLLPPPRCKGSKRLKQQLLQLRTGEWRNKNSMN